MKAMIAVTFNCEWRRSVSADAALIRERVTNGGADVICLTEAYRDFFTSDGHIIEATPGPGTDTGKRKVLLWSRNPWSETTVELPEGAPPGRFASGRTMTPLGEITVMGVCIPYRWAGTRYVEPREEPWAAHLRYLSILSQSLPMAPKRLLVMGDFNQRMPRKYQPQRIFDALNETLLTRLNIATSGVIEDINRQAIDHICHSRDLTVQSVSGICNIGPGGREISDHFGVRVSFTA